VSETVLGRLTGLVIYPLKGAGGISLAASPVERRGLRHDRRWMLVDGRGVFISQRAHPELALVRPELVDDDTLRFGTTREGAGRVELPIDGDGPPLEVEIWGDRVPAWTPSPEADAWFSSILETECRLVVMPEASRRPTDPAYAEGFEVSFADGYPFLMISENSLRELNRRLEHPVPMNRFRPNLVVEAETPAEPHAEDCWPPFRIGELEFRGVKPCARCTVTTVDQGTGIRGLEPLRTLADYRAPEGKVLFGQNLVHRGEGTLRVGDALVASPPGG
jgi:uncharacterized protein